MHRDQLIADVIARCDHPHVLESELEQLAGDLAQLCSYVRLRMRATELADEGLEERAAEACRSAAEELEGLG